MAVERVDYGSDEEYEQARQQEEVESYYAEREREAQREQE